MTTVLTDFSSKLKLALTGRHNVTFVYLNNFEVEEYWGDQGIIKLPSLSIGSASDVVNRMEELGLFLAGENDIILLKSLPDQAFMAEAHSLGFGQSRCIAAKCNEPALNITANLLSCPDALDKLRQLSKNPDTPTYLVPFGTSEQEEELSRITGIPLAVPSSDVFRKVNDKGYSRRLNAELGIRQIPGAECTSLEELASGFERLKPVLEQGGRLVLKDSMGVSGKGITVISDESRFYKCMSLLEKQASKKDIRRVNYVLEQWIDKICDLNYQILIDRSGGVEFLGIKESLVQQGVHQGHLMPSRLSDIQLGIIQEAALRIGTALHRDGYYGIAGMDAILDEDGTIWPNLEINARFNMSTYQTNIQDRWLPEGMFGLAKKYTLRLKRLLEYGELRSRLGGLMFTPENGEGLFINNFATVNAAFKSEGCLFSGRLYGVIIASSSERLRAIDESVEAVLTSISEVM
ncbi:ATP-grasp domain-containing protein [Paenibacillus pabuli]|uniref:preATP grasp domain-containing protein n=1 Tax=Paenibacillus pabuli TaxID=1472 RepID=UPI001FFFCE99|nr:ATP-grasp domain-containing protein [Paenibacillus pabuli]UPK44471.1 ATP-grasp domain-containing protein [Paenibacillus pabuli]